MRIGEYKKLKGIIITENGEAFRDEPVDGQKDSGQDSGWCMWAMPRRKER
jgi:hypothetical protein